MHVVVVGCGRVGSTVARELSATGHDVVVIDKRAEAFRRLGSDWTGRTIVGIGFDRQVLTSADLDAASGVLAVTNGDNTNILVARVARETFGAERVVARIYDPTRARIYERLGIPTVASVTWTAARALRLLHAEVAQPDWVDPTAAFSLVEMTVARGGAGRRFDSLEACGARVMLLRRNGVASIPGADGLMQEADQVHVIVPAGAVAAVHRAVGMDEEVR